MVRSIFLLYITFISLYCFADEPVVDSSAIPFKQDPESVQSAPFDSLIALMMVLVISIGILYVIRGVLRKNGVMQKHLSGDRIAVVSNKRISPGMSAVLLSVDDKEYLVVNKGEQLCVTEHCLVNGKGKPEDV